MKHFIAKLQGKKQKTNRNQTLTLYVTEDIKQEFAEAELQTVDQKSKEDARKSCGVMLQYGSDVMALAISCMILGICYLQWQLPPVFTQYEQMPGQMVEERPLAVDVKNDGLFASMTIEVSDYENLEEARLLINGEEAGTFVQKQLVVRVYPGDVLEIDTSAYLTPCRFQIVKKSSHIREETVADMITTESGYGWIGKISFK